MNWEELIYKLNHLKIERDIDLEQSLKQQNIFGNQVYNKSDLFQDKQNPYNYNVPFDGEHSYSDNIDNLETQLENDDDDNDNDEYNQDDDEEQEEEEEDESNEQIHKLEDESNEQNLDSHIEKQRIAQGAKINQLQCQFFEEFDDKENDCYVEMNKIEQNQKIIKNSDYFPSQKKPLEQKTFSNQQNMIQVMQQKQNMNDTSDLFQKIQGTTVNQDQLNINMFNTFTTLGTGSFGKVKLAKKKGNEKDVFALKMMKKIEIVKLKQVDHIKSEKKILSHIKHPFLVELKGAFQDECFIYMLFEFLSGGEIFSRLRKEGRFSNDISLFYISEIYLALQYLHNQNIVYRDLKPENLLIDRDGHVKIADFGFAKVMDSARTYTLCGTPEYLAPEIIQGAKSGYGKTVDWWALGVLIFEMLSGHPPFYDNDPMGIYQKIVKSVINFPDFFSLRSKDLIRRLLNPNINARLGCADNGASIKTHKWFKGVNWDKVYKKQMPSPWIPNLKAKDDVSCFEKYPESKDTLENPSKDIQKLFADF